MCIRFFPPFCLCIVVCGHQRTGWEAELIVLFPPPPSPLLLFLLLLPPGSPPSHYILPSTPHPRVFPSLHLAPICVPQILEWRPPPSVPHHPPPPQLPPLPVGPGNERGNDWDALVPACLRPRPPVATPSTLRQLPRGTLTLQSGDLRLRYVTVQSPVSPHYCRPDSAQQRADTKKAHIHFYSGPDFCDYS